MTIEIYRGSHKQWEAIVKLVSDNSVVDITTAKLTFCVKQVKVDPDIVADITKRNTAAGGNDTEIKFKINGSDGGYQVLLIPSDTEDMDNGLYYYTVEMELGGETRIIADGVFEILPHAC